MRVTIERSAFLKALTHVQSVVERRNTIPILSNVLVQAKATAKSSSPRPTSISRSSKPTPAEVAKDGCHHGRRPHAV